MAVALQLSCPSCGCSAKGPLRKQRPDLFLYWCPSCSLVYQSSRLSLASIETIYGNEYYDSWGLEQNQDDLWRMKVKTCLAYLDLLGPHLVGRFSPRQLLDIGCAHGFMLEAAKQKGFEPYGVEISPAASAARSRGFIVYDRPLPELNLSADTFDVVTAIDVIEHLPDIKAFVFEIYRIVKPEGLFILVTPDVGSWIAMIMKNAWPHYKPEHLVYFTKRSLSVLLENIGFRIIYIDTGFKYLTLDYIVRHFKKHTPGVLTSLLKCLEFALPSTLKNTALYLPTEMIAIAKRVPASPPQEPLLSRNRVT